MDNITHYLNLPEKAKVLDLACGGKTFHLLEPTRFDRTYLVPSENSILEAQKKH
jgi:hypothetical protein